MKAPSAAPARRLLDSALSKFRRWLGPGMLALAFDALFRKRGLAVLSGLLFATHPVHTEAVTRIVGLAEVLSALCSCSPRITCMSAAIGAGAAARRSWCNSGRKVRRR